MKFNKLVIAFIVIFLIATIGLIYFSIKNMSKPTATIAGKQLELLVADNASERRIGLSNTLKLNENEAMYFIFDEKNSLSFWMKDMDFPIDIIFLDDNKVVNIHKNVPNPKTNDDASLPLYDSLVPSNRVLETVAGFSDKNNLKVGDSISVKLK